MTFSIITVTYNPGEKLLPTVKSILDQTFADFEIVIKDGGSKDGSLDAVEALGDEHIKIFKAPDKGIYDAMNEAVKLSLGEFVLFLNAGDTFYSKDVLEKTAKALEGSNSQDAYEDANVLEKSNSQCTGEITRADDLKSNALKNYDGPLKNTIAYGDTYFCLSKSLSKAPSRITGSVCYRNIPNHQAIFYSRDTLLNRGFDTSYKIRADFEHFSYCYFKAHTSFVYLDFPINNYEGGGFSETHKKLDKEEYKRAVRANIPLKERFRYRLILILTLHKLRGFLSKNEKTAAFYQKVKEHFV